MTLAITSDGHQPRRREKNTSHSLTLRIQPYRCLAHFQSSSNRHYIVALVKGPNNVHDTPETTKVCLLNFQPALYIHDIITPDKMSLRRSLILFLCSLGLSKADSL